MLVHYLQAVLVQWQPVSSLIWKMERCQDLYCPYPSGCFASALRTDKLFQTQSHQYNH